MKQQVSSVILREVTGESTVASRLAVCTMQDDLHEFNSFWFKVSLWLFFHFNKSLRASCAVAASCFAIFSFYYQLCSGAAHPEPGVLSSEFGVI